MSAFYCEKWKYKCPTYKTTQGSVRCKISATTQRKIVTECYIWLRWIGPLSYTAEQPTRNEVVHWEVLATKCSGTIWAKWSPLCRPFINPLVITGKLNLFRQHCCFSMYSETNAIIPVKHYIEKPVYWFVT